MKKRLAIEVESDQEFEEIQAAIESAEMRPIVRVLGTLAAFDPDKRTRILRASAELHRELKRTS